MNWAEDATNTKYLIPNFIDGGKIKSSVESARVNKHSGVPAVWILDPAPWGVGGVCDPD